MTTEKMSVEQALGVLAKGEWPIDLVVEASQALATLRAELAGLWNLEGAARWWSENGFDYPNDADRKIEDALEALDRARSATHPEQTP